MSDWLTRCDLFGELSPADLRQIEAELQWRELEGGELLFAQGDPGGSLFLVVGGRLQVERTVDGRTQVMAEIGPTESVGEMSVITGEARTADVRAIRDSSVVELSQEACDRFLANDRRLSRKLNRLIVQRYRRTMGEEFPRRSVTITILPLGPTAAALEFAQTLQEALALRIPTIVTDSGIIDSALGQGSATVERGDPRNRSVIEWLTAREQQHECMLYVGDASDTPWTRRALRQADVVLLLARSDADPLPTAFEQSLLGNAGPGGRARCELVLLHDSGDLPVSGTLAWKQGRRLDRLHLVRRGNSADSTRLAELLSGISSVPPWLRNSELFSGLDRDQLRLLHAEFSWMHLGGQDVLFSEGSPGDGLFLIVSGRLQAFQTAAAGEQRVLREMGPGDVLGEIALVTGENRTASVRAVRDSTVVKLSRGSFDLLARRNPALVLRLVQLIVNRLVGRSSPKHETRALNLTIVPLDAQVDSMQFAESLHRGLSLLGKTAVLGAEVLESRLGRGASQFNRGDAGDDVVIEWLNNLEVDHDFVLYHCDPRPTPWTVRCLRQADRILLLVDAGSDPAQGPLERELFGRCELGRHVRKSLVLLHDAGCRRGEGTANWLNARQADDHFHVRRGQNADFARLARLVTDRGVGLSLSGGGGRGIAHLGVYRALVEAGVPVDVVSGTSSGSVIAGLIALEDTPGVALHKMIVTMNRRWGHFFSMGPPLVSLMSGAHLARILNPIYENALIEDLFIPFAAVSTDVISGEQMVHRRGPLWLAVRASMSLPGAWPPVPLDGKLLVDGAVLNNLPVDVIQPRCKHGAVIASDIAEQEDVSEYSPYGSHLSGWRLLAGMCNPLSQKLKVPTIIELLARCAMLDSSRKVQGIRRDKQLLYLAPPVGEFGMFEIHGDRMVRTVEQRGYDHAREQLANWGWLKNGGRPSESSCISP